MLVNFLHIGQLALLGELRAYRFQFPTEVLQELTDPGQRAAVDNTIAAGQFDLLVIDALDALALFGDLRDLMGRGEAACLALAATTGLVELELLLRRAPVSDSQRAMAQASCSSAEPPDTLSKRFRKIEGDISAIPDLPSGGTQPSNGQK